jgi:hypothetical protein
MSVSQGLVDVAPMADCDDKHEPTLVVNLIDDSVVADADAVEVVDTLKLL